MTVSNDLEKIGIFKVRKEYSKTKKVFDLLFNDILTLPMTTASNFIEQQWSIYNNSSLQERDLNGNVFETFIAVLLYRLEIYPLYIQATLAFVPNAKFDIIAYNSQFGVLSLSIKTSLRERYKQADLEAFALKSVHRNSKCYLITLSEKEASNVNKKIKASEMLGLDKVIVATNDEFNKFVQELKTYKYSEAGTFSIVSQSETKVN